MNTYKLLTALVGDKLKEDAPANAVGGGNVAGVGVGPQGEPPGKKALMKQLQMMKRRQPNVDVGN